MTVEKTETSTFSDKGVFVSTVTCAKAGGTRLKMT